MNIPQGLSRAQTRSFLQRQIGMGRYMILGTAILTLVNLLMLLFGGEFYIPYSFAAAYYLVWFGMGFDNDFAYNWSQVGVNTRTGLVLAAVLLGLLVLFWYLARRDEKWIKISMIVFAVDAVLLAVLSFAVMEQPLDCLWELVIHGAVIWEMNKALSARKHLDAMRREAREPEPVL